MASPKAWTEAVLARADELGVDLILPLTEASLGSLFLYGLDEDERVVCPERARYDRCVDKHALMLRAAELGIDVPKGVFVEDPAALSELPVGLSFPVVLKPRRSRFLADGCWQSAEVRVARDQADWDRARHDPGMRAGSLIQEFVAGHGEAVFLLCQHGEPRVHFAHRRLREKPPTGGQSVLRESIEPDAQLLAWSETLLRDFGWNGVAMVEFRRAPSGRAVLMEINPRLWGSLQLAIDSGVDFPALMVDLHLGRTIPKTEPRIGVRTRWLLGDLDHLLICLRRPRMRKEIGTTVPRLLLDFARSFFDGTRNEVLRMDDWRPFIRDLRRWIRE